jgi:hypothetical protein
VAFPCTPLPQEDVAGPSDVIGEASSSGGGGGVGGVVAGLFARGGGGANAAAARDGSGGAFALGERGNILHHLDQAAIIPHVAEAESKKAPPEVCSAPSRALALLPITGTSYGHDNTCIYCMRACRCTAGSTANRPAAILFLHARVCWRMVGSTAHRQAGSAGGSLTSSTARTHALCFCGLEASAGAPMSMRGCWG